jgi:hypothetical protein
MECAETTVALTLAGTYDHLTPSSIAEVLMLLSNGVVVVEGGPLFAVEVVVVVVEAGTGRMPVKDEGPGMFRRCTGMAGVAWGSVVAEGVEERVGEERGGWAWF